MCFSSTMMLDDTCRSAIGRIEGNSEHSTERARCTEHKEHKEHRRPVVLRRSWNRILNRASRPTRPARLSSRGIACDGGGGGGDGGWFLCCRWREKTACYPQPPWQWWRPKGCAPILTLFQRAQPFRVRLAQFPRGRISFLQPLPLLLLARHHLSSVQFHPAILPAALLFCSSASGFGSMPSIPQAPVPVSRPSRSSRRDRVQGSCGARANTSNPPVSPCPKLHAACTAGDLTTHDEETCLGKCTDRRCWCIRRQR